MITLKTMPGAHKTHVVALVKHEKPYNYIIHLSEGKTEKAAKAEAKKQLQELIKSL